MRLGIDIGLRGANPQRPDSAKGGDALEDRVRQRFLKIVSPRRGNLLHLVAEEVIIPCPIGIVLAGQRETSSSQISTVTSSRCGAPTSNSWKPMST